MITLLFLQTTNNSPDLILYNYPTMFMLIPVYFIYTFLNYFIIQGTLLAFVNELYKESCLKHLEKIRENAVLMG